MKKINPFLWFDSEAEQAAKFYVGIFKNSKIGKITHYSEDGPGPKGSVMTVEFTLDKVDFVALNGGPQFKFTEAISFSVNCETQDEIDYFWEKLSADGDRALRLAQRQIRSLVAGLSRLSRRHVGRSRC
jgi:predicted 3-demethylubiquinone-9 3-methyltransferase (glyoxalase superfamily)